jgi:ParB family transcriptional regulator, chromosome partitioning protein
VSRPAKKSALDVSYLKTATSKTLASSIFTSQVKEEQQRLIHEKQPQQIAIELLQDNPYQPRQTLDETSLQQLADTITSQGFQGVLVARPHPQQAGIYQITAGHRRREAARKAGLQTLPTIVHPWSDQDMATLAATENIQRENLSPLEEGKLFQLMIDELKLTQVEVANAVKKDRGYVRNRLRLATSPADIQAFVTAKPDSMRAVIYLLDIEDPAERAPIIERLLQRTLTTEDLPAYVEEIKRQKQSASLPSSTLQPSQPVSSASPAISQPSQPVSSASPTIALPPQPVSSPFPSTTKEEPAQPSHKMETPAPQPPVLSPTTSIAEPKERLSTQIKARQTRLRAIYRQLIDYQQLLAEQEEPPTATEQTLLQQIHEVIQQLSRN